MIPMTFNSSAMYRWCMSDSFSFKVHGLSQSTVWAETKPLGGRQFAGLWFRIQLTMSRYLCETANTVEREMITKLCERESCEAGISIAGMTSQRARHKSGLTAPCSPEPHTPQLLLSSWMKKGEMEEEIGCSKYSLRKNSFWYTGKSKDVSERCLEIKPWASRVGWGMWGMWEDAVGILKIYRV